LVSAKQCFCVSNQTTFSSTVLLAAEEREQDIPGKLEQEAESEEAPDAVPGKPATGMPDRAGEAVSNTEEESSAPVKQAVEGPAGTFTRGMQGQVAESAGTVTNSGMQGQVAESAGTVTNSGMLGHMAESAGTVTNSGMQGQVAESATSSNARQQSTSSVASARPASASKPTSTIGACTCTLQATTVFA